MKLKHNIALWTLILPAIALPVILENAIEFAKREVKSYYLADTPETSNLDPTSLLTFPAESVITETTENTITSVVAITTTNSDGQETTYSVTAVVTSIPQTVSSSTSGTTDTAIFSVSAYTDAANLQTGSIGSAIAGLFGAILLIV